MLCHQVVKLHKWFYPGQIAMRWISSRDNVVHYQYPWIGLVDRSVGPNFIEWSLNNNNKDCDSGSKSKGKSRSLNILFAGLWDLVRKVCNGSGAEGASSRKPGILGLNPISIGLFLSNIDCKERVFPPYDFALRFKIGVCETCRWSNFSRPVH